MESKQQKKANGAVTFNPRTLTHAKIYGDDEEGFKHAILTDVSGKGVIYENVNFSYSFITRGYFHKAEFIKCKFFGVRFEDLNFRGAVFSGCDFDYADFNGTRIVTSEILSNLPKKPNVRRELLQILRKNAISLGDVASARSFVLAEIDAKKEHLRRAWRGEGDYYKEKYSGSWKKFKVGLERIGLWADSFLWGHGERLWKMVFPILLLLTAASSIYTISWVSEQGDPRISSIISEIYYSFVYYINLFLDVQNGGRDISSFIWLDWIVVIARYLAFGVLVTGLFRWLSHR